MPVGATDAGRPDTERCMVSCYKGELPPVEKRHAISYGHIATRDIIFYSGDHAYTYIFMLIEKLLILKMQRTRHIAGFALCSDL